MSDDCGSDKCDENKNNEQPPTRDSLETILDQTNRTLDYQIDTLSDIDDKAIRIYRANILFLSIVIGLASVAVGNSSPDIDVLININSVIGVTLLIGSLAAGAITYRASALQGGIDPREVDRAYYEKQRKRDSVSMIVNKNKEYISHNDSVLQDNGRFITYTTIITINALAYIAAGVFITGTVNNGTSDVIAVLPLLVSLPAVIIYSNVLSFPELAGGRHLLYTGISILPTIIVTGAWVCFIEAHITYIWVAVPFYFLMFTVSNVIYGYPKQVWFFSMIFILNLATAVLLLSPSALRLSPSHPAILAMLLPDSIFELLLLVHPVDFSLFVLVGALLLIIDDRIY
ncbi:hypothetical protein RBH20_13385 [Haloarcula sp. H-GB4]|uniref:hypothetical protein n=1 Tax=Haloarcula sp. H-GB4 TaxID=3069755 RepID=UPI0027B71D26|nr:hypothetical protein [Haloarcula sp. H-GB4]MDQ2073526.1 hypothetical protein [Haloarcula sp. H-GB4]